MGNMRAGRDYYNLSSLVERLAPGKLVDEDHQDAAQLCQ